jgi:hypothetical protein
MRVPALRAIEKVLSNGCEGRKVMASSIKWEGREYLEPFEKHTGDSKWQFCNCLTCQNKRCFLDGLPGKPIDYQTFRNKDERY